MPNCLSQCCHLLHTKMGLNGINCPILKIGRVGNTKLHILNMNIWFITICHKHLTDTEFNKNIDFKIFKKKKKKDLKG